MGHLIERKRLKKAMDPLAKCILISAPSGYGKSVLLNQWVSEKPCIRVDIKKNGISEKDLWKSLLLQLEHSKGQQLLQSSANFTLDEIYDMLLVSFSNQGNPTLVLDDYQWVRSGNVHQFLIRIIEDPLFRAQVIIASRNDPPFPLIEWKQKEWLFEIRYDQLRFNKSEVATLLNARPFISTFHIEQVLGISEGWISGIRLMLYNVQDANEMDAKLRAIGRLENPDFEHLVDLFLGKLSAEEKKSMMVLALLDQFEEKMLLSFGAISSSCIRIIKELSESGLFIIKIRQNQYRFHHLFRDILNHKSESFLTPREKEFFWLKTIEWLTAHNQGVEAIKYCLLVHNQDKAKSIFNEVRRELLNQCHWTELNKLYGLMQDLPYPEVKLTKCWLQIQMGKSEILFKEIESFTEEQILSLEKELKGEYLALKSYYTYNITLDYNACLVDCTEALNLINPNFGYARGYAWVFKLGALQVKGALAEVKRIFDNNKNGIENPIEKEYMLLVMCYVYWLEADMEQLYETGQILKHLGEKHNSFEGIGHANHFITLASFMMGQEVESLLEECRATRKYTIGVIKLFNILLEASILHAKGLGKQAVDFLDTCIDKLDLDPDNIMRQYWLGHKAELTILLGNKNKALSITNVMSEMPVVPITNNADPNLSRALVYIKMEDPTYSEKAEHILRLVYTQCSRSHNKMGMLYVHILQLLLAVQRKDTSSYRKELKAALEISEKGNLLMPFLPLTGNLPAVLKTTSLGEKQNNWVLKNNLAKIKENLVAAPSQKLSKRELEIVQYFAKEYSNNKIADTLFIAEKTVKNHSNTLFKKLKVKNRKEAVQMAKKLLLLEELADN